MNEEQRASVHTVASEDYTRLSKSELVDQLNRLQGQPVSRWQVDEAPYLLHELRVHQIELELQNRMLRESLQALEESRDRYAEYYDFAPVGYLTLDRKATIIDLNLRAASFLGRERSRLIGAPLIPMLARGESRVLLRHLAQVFKSNRKVVHGVLFRGSGDELKVVRLQSVITAGDYCHTAMIDITDQRRAEEELREKGKQFHTIFEQAAMGVAIIDSHTGRFERVNRKFADICGYPSSELLTLKMMQLTHSHDLPRILLNVKRVLRHEIYEFSQEIRAFNKNGDIVWLKLTVSPVWDGSVIPDYYIAIIEDISQRKFIEAMLEGRREVLKSMARGASLDSVLTQLVSTAEALDPDMRCAVMLLEEGHLRVGAAPSLPDGIDRFFSAEVEGDHCSLCGSTIESGKTVVVEDILASPQFANVLTFAQQHDIRACWAVPVVASSGQVIGLFAAFHRETYAPTRSDFDYAEGSAELASIAIERQHSEAQARRHLDELAHMARLTMLGEMSTGLAHELNQPLAAITTYVDIARRKLRDIEQPPEMMEEALQGTREQAMRASVIIRHLRDLVRKQPSQMMETDLNELILGVLELLEYDLRKSRTKFSLRLQPGLPDVMADNIQLEQVFLNLLHNSMEAMESAGTEKRLVKISTVARDDGWVQVSVADTGPGIDEAIMPRMFEPFVTTKEASGLGMGLSICRSIIEVHGGRLWVESKRGHGATFFMTLPMAGSGE